MLISIGLATRFEQINDRLARNGNEVRTATIFFSIKKSCGTKFVPFRPIYMYRTFPKMYGMKFECITCLCVNCSNRWTLTWPHLFSCRAQTTCILFAFSCSIFSSKFLCVQRCRRRSYFIYWFNSPTFGRFGRRRSKLPYAINYVYFWYSLLYLIGRTICMFLCASAINDASRRPNEFIRRIRTTGWCTEVSRFTIYIYNIDERAGAHLFTLLLLLRIVTFFIKPLFCICAVYLSGGWWVGGYGNIYCIYVVEVYREVLREMCAFGISHPSAAASARV